MWLLVIKFAVSATLTLTIVPKHPIAFTTQMGCENVRQDIEAKQHQPNPLACEQLTVVHDAKVEESF